MKIKLNNLTLFTLLYFSQVPQLATRGVARHNFKRRQLSPTLPKNGVQGFHPQNFFGILHCCIGARVLVHFRRTKTNFPLP